MQRTYLRGTRILAIVTALSFIPLTITFGDGFTVQANAAAGGNGKGGDNGNAGGNGKGGDQASNAGGNGKSGSSDGNSDVSVAANGKEKSDLLPSDLGRLNAFMNA